MAINPNAYSSGSYWSQSIGQSAGLYGAGASSQPVVNPIPEAMLAEAALQLQLPQLQLQFAQALTGLIPLANVMQTDANALQSGTTNSVIDQSTATSSNPAVLSGTTLPGATQTAYSFGVSAIAQGQVNTGTALNPTSTQAYDLGTQSLAITLAGQPTQTVSYNLTANDNQTALTTIAAAINAQVPQLQASVIPTTGGNVQLQVASTQTGASQAFTIADQPGGNVVALAGLANVSQTAQDTIYSLNGSPQPSSPTNTLVLDNGNLTVTLLAPSSSLTTLNVAQNTAAYASAINQFVGDFNSLLSYSQANATTLSPSIEQGLMSASGAQAGALQSIGISVGAGGALSVDQTALNNALTNTPNQVESLLSSPTGLAAAVGATANVITTTPSFAFAQAPSAIPTAPLISAFLEAQLGSALGTASLGLLINQQA